MTRRPRTPSIPFVLFIVFMIALLALAGCGGKEEPPPQEATPQPIVLPRLSLRISEDGSPEFLGIPLSKVMGLLGQDASAVSLPPETLALLTGADIQNVELVIRGDSIIPFVNGQALPYIALDEETRDNLGTLLRLAGIDDATADRVHNLLNNDIVSRLGIPIVLRFPLAPGATEVPLRDKDSLSLVDADEQRAGVNAPLLIAHVDVALDQAGVPTIAGNSMTEYQNAFQTAGLPVDLSSARIDPALVASLAAADVQILQVETEPEGLYLYVNGSMLPTVAWDQARLNNAVDLYSNLEPDSPYLPILRFLAPYIQPTDVELALFLPLTGNTQPAKPRPFIKN